MDLRYKLSHCVSRSKSRVWLSVLLLELVVVCRLVIVHADEPVEVRAISSRPEVVSGGDVLVELRVPTEQRWAVQLNDLDVSASFHFSRDRSAVLGLLNGLNAGKNAIRLLVNGVPKASLTLWNHPLSGPILSGPHQKPFVCQTEANGLGPALNADCFADVKVTYYYKSSESAPAKLPNLLLERDPSQLRSGFKAYDPATPVPSDVSRTQTSDGRIVPFVVRRERGVINRAVYDIEMLHEPGAELPNPWTRTSAGWNGRLVYIFGGGCAAGYRQGKLGFATNDPEPFLAAGYAVATATLTMFGNDCNDRVSSETLSMMEEYFTKRFGRPVHVIGVGGSGGAIQQHLIAQNYPGLLDGLVVAGSRPDISSAIQLFTDCRLLDHAFETSQERWTEEQKTAVTGLASWRVCHGGMERFLDPKSCDESVPEGEVYDRLKNPRGARCDVYDNEVNVLGRDPKTGFAKQSLDNVGVQYGLAAFNADTISAEQFIEINERVGGYDSDGTIVAERTAAEPGAVAEAYERGFVMTGGGGLSDVPIIDWRSYSDDIFDNHIRFLSFVTRARLAVANGAADNQVIIVYPRYDILALFDADRFEALQEADDQRQRELVIHMDRWLDAAYADRAPGTQLAKLARNKPKELADHCVATDGNVVTEAAVYHGPGKCNQLYPAFGDPRLVAGVPLTDNVLKCTLKPLKQSDYSRPLTLAQVQRLRVVFPTGVCDYSKKGLGQRPIRETWQRF